MVTRILLCLLLISGCGAKNSHTIRYVGLSDMITADTEQVNLDIDAPDAIPTLHRWILQDVPSSAMLACSPQSTPCDEAIILLKSFRVPHTIESITSVDNKILMMYDRISERPCDPRGYGCGQELNALMMVEQPRKIKHPDPMDYPSSSRFVFD